MTVMIHPCGWKQPHAPHAFDVVHPTVPSLVTTLSCVGTPVTLLPVYPPVTQDEIDEVFKK